MTGFIETAGTFRIIDGVLCFDGNMDESARIFFEHYLKPMCDNYIKDQSSLTSGVTAEGQAIANKMARKDLG